MAYGIYFPDGGWNSGPLHWEHGVLATEPPRKSQETFKSLFCLAVINFILRYLIVLYFIFLLPCLGLLELIAWLKKIVLKSSQPWYFCPIFCNLSFWDSKSVSPSISVFITSLWAFFSWLFHAFLSHVSFFIFSSDLASNSIILFTSV